MPSEIFATRISWVAVARAVSEKLGRKYSANYCREVAIGFRSSSVIEPVLKELGAMQEEQAVAA